MKISKIIDELTELKEYIGDKDLHECIVNDAMTSINVIYFNDFGGFTSTSLEGEKKAHQLKATMGDQNALGKIKKVKVLRLDLCDGSDDPELVAIADVGVMTNTSFLTINDLGLKYNDATGEYSIVAPKLLTGVCLNESLCIAVTSFVAARYEQIKHSDEMHENT